jgi:hypothetical protein
MDNAENLHEIKEKQLEVPGGESRTLEVARPWKLESA